MFCYDLFIFLVINRDFNPYLNIGIQVKQKNFFFLLSFNYAYSLPSAKRYFLKSSCENFNTNLMKNQYPNNILWCKLNYLIYAKNTLPIIALTPVLEVIISDKITPKTYLIPFVFFIFELKAYVSVFWQVVSPLKLSFAFPGNFREIPAYPRFSVILEHKHENHGNVQKGSMVFP